MARLMTGLNDLATVNPDLAAEWHPTKNAPLLPSQVTGGSSKKVWWLGKCGHEWEAVISKRSGRGDGCPLCRKSRPKTHEEFCKSINKINPFIEITGMYVKSNVRVSVRCKKCGFEWSTKPNTLQQGSGCPRCAKTGTSRSEQYLCVFMEQVFGIESVLNRDKTSIGLELDVVCGKHAWEYGSWFWHKPKRKQAIDLEKYERCRERGITLHIIYDSCAGERSKIPSSICFDYDLWQEIDHKSLKRICIKGAKEISPDVDLSSIDWESIEIESARRCRALSPEEYSAEVESIYNGKIIIDSASFKSIANRVKAHCTSCGKTWSPLAYSLVQGHGCRKCAYDLAVTNRVGVTAKKTHDMFIEELRKKNLLYAKSQFHLLGSYTGSKEKIPCQCNVCNHEWHASPQALLAGRGCPKCGYRVAGKLTSERKRLDSQTFKNRIAEKSPSLELLSDYKCAKEKIKTRCRKCGYTWMASPISLNAGSLCPACANHVVFRGHNDLGTVNPNLSAEWHPIKNGSLTPADVVAGSTKRVWWQCSKGHGWKAQICERHRRNLGCPQCAIEARRIPIQCIETGDIYDSYASAAHAVGLKGCGGIAVACKNQNRTSGGYHWRLKN